MKMMKLLLSFVSLVYLCRVAVLTRPLFFSMGGLLLIGLGFLFNPDVVYSSGTDNLNPAPAQSWKDPHTGIDRSIDDSKTALTLVAGSIGTMAMGANSKTGKVVGLGLALMTQRTGSYILEQQRRALHEKVEINLELNREFRGATPKALPISLPNTVDNAPSQEGLVNPSSSGISGNPEGGGVVRR